jgi:hypothetical protein
MFPPARHLRPNHVVKINDANDAMTAVFLLIKEDCMTKPFAEP